MYTNKRTFFFAASLRRLQKKVIFLMAVPFMIEALPPPPRA
jgi:hypothetical protein